MSSQITQLVLLVLGVVIVVSIVSVWFKTSIILGDPSTALRFALAGPLMKARSFASDVLFNFTSNFFGTIVANFINYLVSGISSIFFVDIDIARILTKVVDEVIGDFINIIDIDLAAPLIVGKPINNPVDLNVWVARSSVLCWNHYEFRNRNSEYPLMSVGSVRSCATVSYNLRSDANYHLKSGGNEIKSGKYSDLFNLNNDDLKGDDLYYSLSYKELLDYGVFLPPDLYTIGWEFVSKVLGENVFAVGKLNVDSDCVLKRDDGNSWVLNPLVCALHGKDKVLVFKCGNGECSGGFDLDKREIRVNGELFKLSFDKEKVSSLVQGDNVKLVVDLYYGVRRGSKEPEVLFFKDGVVSGVSVLDTVFANDFNSRTDLRVALCYQSGDCLHNWHNGFPVISSGVLKIGYQDNFPEPVRNEFARAFHEVKFFRWDDCDGDLDDYDPDSRVQPFHGSIYVQDCSKFFGLLGQCLPNTDALLFCVMDDNTVKEGGGWKQ